MATKESSEELDKKLYEKKSLLLPCLIEIRGLLNHHIASFNHLIDYEMKKILLHESNNTIKSSIDPNFVIFYRNIRVLPPQEIVAKGQPPKYISPHECRLRDLTYRGDLIVDVEYSSREKGPRFFSETNIKIGSIPIMLKSSRCNLVNKSEEELVTMRECPLDPGGYFIVRGVERVFLVQEQQSKNRVIIDTSESDIITAQVQSKTHYSISNCSIHLKKNCIFMTHRSFTDEIPIVVLLKALGLESDQEICEYIGYGDLFDNILYACFEQAFRLNVRTQNEALMFIGEHRKETWETEESQFTKMPQKSKADKAADFLANVLLCHIREGQIQWDWNFRHKALYVCFMVRRIIETSAETTLLDERDFYGNKRFETTGTLMGLLFEDLLKSFNRVVRTAMDQQLSKKDTTRPFSVRQIMESKSEILQNGMRMAISTGRWDLKRFNMSRQGITQILSRLSYLSCIGMMTRLTSSFEKTRKMTGPRTLRPSQWGMVCPCDTPEGESCGLVKNFALLSQVTLDMDDTLVRAAIHNFGLEEVDTITPYEFRTFFSVFLNGQFIGIHRYPSLLCDSLRKLRRSGRLHPHVSISLQQHQRAVQVGSDGGRVVRLYLIVERGSPTATPEHFEDLQRGLLGISDFLVNGLAEFIDVNEENDTLIAVQPSEITKWTTHMEVEPFSLLGVVAGVIPYPHHNQSARNTFQSAMGKQAIGGISCNQQWRADTMLLVGIYPQKPLCRTKSMSLTHYEELGAGINAMVCVMSYSGYDIEDAQVYNRFSLDRGYARCMVLRKYEVDLQRFHDGECDVIFPPIAQDKATRRVSYLNRDGIISKDAPVRRNDILVNRHTVDSSGASRPRPLRYHLPQPAVVDHVLITPAMDSDRAIDVEMRIKVVLREVRVPELGDKFSSRHGQKGVVGLITDGVNLPFNEQGIMPDMIMNPHGFPSRMTVGKLLELTSGKAALLKGAFGDGTAFSGDRIEDIGATLLQFGYEYTGKDIFYSGITGDIIPGYVFFGPIYYQRLKHMVIDKMHARGLGPKSSLTRQPTEGRSNDGGLRVGEMERDCMVGYGASMLLNERLLKSSDLFLAEVCRRCGHLGFKNFCPKCHLHGTTVSVKLPYAFKLLLQELEGMGISTRLVVQGAT